MARGRCTQEGTGAHPVCGKVGALGRLPGTHSPRLPHFRLISSRACHHVARVEVDRDGRTIAEMLDWAGRETGRRIEYASAEAARAARETELRGSIDLEPMRAIELVLPTGNLRGEVHNGVIGVSLIAVD